MAAQTKNSWDQAAVAGSYKTPLEYNNRQVQAHIQQRRSQWSGYCQGQANCPLSEPPDPGKHQRRSRQGSYGPGKLSLDSGGGGGGAGGAQWVVWAVGGLSG